MPGVEDWINRPLEIVEKIFDQQGGNCHDSVVNYFAKQLKGTTEAFKLVPSLNEFPLHQLKANGLVHFRCMIQDMFDPEFYLGTYEVVDKHNNHRTLKCGLYKDVMDCKPIEEIDMNSPRNVTADRLSYYCVSVPGENSWVKEGFCCSKSVENSCSSSTYCGRLKRTLDSDGDNDVEMADEEAGNEHKKNRIEASSSNGRTGAISGTNALPNMNFPLPNEGGTACLVKLYSNTENLKVTDVIEVFGILSIDPHLAGIGNKSDCNEDEEMEMAAHNPPPSLVPRLHAIFIRNLPYNVPYLPPNVKLSDSSAIEILSQAKKIREELINILTEALLGDVLAAEYLLFHLISSVYFRQDVTVLGKFCLNLINFPLQGYTKGLYNLLQKLVAKSHFLELSLQNLNSKSFTPWKDYTSNRLISGILQLSPHTHLVVDETALSTGQLDSKGVQNVGALKHLIQWQNVEYDFKFHKISYPCNIGVLVLSEGKSILDSDCQVRISAVSTPEEMKMHLSSLESRLDDTILKKFRIYVTLLKLANYDLNEEIKKIVQEDFVRMRKENPQMTGDDLHLLLILGRFQSLSVGEMTLTKESWDKVKAMEAERRRRLQPAASA